MAKACVNVLEAHGVWGKWHICACSSVFSIFFASFHTEVDLFIRQTLVNKIGGGHISNSPLINKRLYLFLSAWIIKLKTAGTKRENFCF